jgi:hypothetical protein
MSRTTQITPTNKTVGSISVPTVRVGIASNYSKIADTKTGVTYKNRTTPRDADEYISYSSRRIDRVDTELNVQHPDSVTAGCLYGVKTQTIARTTDDTDATVIVDHPIVLETKIRHEMTTDITVDVIVQVFARHLGAFINWIKVDGESSPTFVDCNRLEDLMRSILEPNSD